MSCIMKQLSFLVSFEAMKMKNDPDYVTTRCMKKFHRVDVVRKLVFTVWRKCKLPYLQRNFHSSETRIMEEFHR